MRTLFRRPLRPPPAPIGICLLSVLLYLSAGCSDQATASRTTFAVSVGGGESANLANDFGYKARLEQAKLHLGPIYFFSGEPLFARRSKERWPWRVLRKILGTGIAHAHPGHYQEGEALAEVLDAATFDLLAKQPRRLGEANGVTGAYRSAQVTLEPAADNGGHTLVLKGSAEKGARSVRFIARLDIDKKVTGIAARAEVRGEGAMMVEIDLASWIKRIDFSKLPTGAEVEIKPGSQAYNALYRGVYNTSAFRFAFNNK